MDLYTDTCLILTSRFFGPSLTFLNLEEKGILRWLKQGDLLDPGPLCSSPCRGPPTGRPRPTHRPFLDGFFTSTFDEDDDDLVSALVCQVDG